MVAAAAVAEDRSEEAWPGNIDARVLVSAARNALDALYVQYIEFAARACDANPLPEQACGVGTGVETPAPAIVALQDEPVALAQQQAGFGMDAA